MNDQSPERTVASQSVYRGRIIGLRVDTVELTSGRTTAREIVEHPGTVVIVAIDDRSRVALVRQYRSAIGRETLEVPAGTREPNENAATCAARELGEEMGVAAARWFPLVGFFSSPGFCTEFLDCFVARDLSPLAREPEEDETIQRVWIDLSDVPALIARGDLCDVKSIASLLAYIQREQSGDRPWQK